MKTLVVIANIKVPLDEQEDSRELEDELSHQLQKFLISIGYKNFLLAIGPQRKFMSKRERKKNAI